MQYQNILLLGRLEKLEKAQNPLQVELKDLKRKLLLNNLEKKQVNKEKEQLAEK